VASILRRAGSTSAPVPPPVAAMGLDTPLGRTVTQLMLSIEELVQQVPGGTQLHLNSSRQAEPEAPSEQAVARANAAHIVTMRKLRERAFGADLFSDPAWAILLELYLAFTDNCDVSVGNACLASALPLTSALRLCQQLQERNILVRQRDPHDRRRVLLRLSDAAFEALTHILAGTKAPCPMLLPPAA
jgi:DNA-binding MarR family transcriptional regulator